MAGPVPDTSRPGEELYRLLKTLVPPTKNFPQVVDDLLRADGSFFKILYESTLLYVLRRLVRTAQFVERQGRTDRDLYVQLRRQLRDEFALEENVEVALSLLVLAVQCARDDVTAREKASID